MVCGCCAKFSREIEPKALFWVHYATEHSLLRHICLLWVPLQHPRNILRWAVEQNTQKSGSHLSFGLECVLEIGQLPFIYCMLFRAGSFSHLWHSIIFISNMLRSLWLHLSKKQSIYQQHISILIFFHIVASSKALFHLRWLILTHRSVVCLEFEC